MSGFNNQAEEESPKIEGRRFQGLVVFNNDPEKRQRIKVLIPNLLEGNPDDLPWIGPAVQSGFGMTNTAVSVAVPVIDSVVMVTFQDGDLNYGMYDSSLHTALSNQLNDLAANYPNRRGWVDPAGNVCYVDITPGQTTFHLRHISGTNFTIANSGAVTVTAVADLRATAPRIHLN
jgi:hypothetical protein